MFTNTQTILELVTSTKKLADSSKVAGILREAEERIENLMIAALPAPEEPVANELGKGNKVMAMELYKDQVIKEGFPCSVRMARIAINRYIAAVEQCGNDAG